MTNRNVVINSNWVVNLNPAADNYLQGITIFDGKWDGLKVSNNLVVTNTWHGISLYGVNNALVVNNTVIATKSEKFPTWLTVRSAKDKEPSQHVVVRNNIATQVSVEGTDVTVDHNIARKHSKLYNPLRG